MKQKGFRKRVTRSGRREEKGENSDSLLDNETRK
jgi:hypothetical protein